MMLLANILVICSVFFNKMNLIIAFRLNTKISNLNHQSRCRYLIKGFMSSKSTNPIKAAKSPTVTSTNNDVGNTPFTIRVAYQGEPGAYSEKAARELLGPRVTTGTINLLLLP